MTPSDLPPAGGWAALEERVVSALRAEGLVRFTPHKGVNVRKLHARWAVAAAVLLALGIYVGSEVHRLTTLGIAGANAQPMAQFALLLYEDASYRSAPPEGQQARIAEYAGWARKLAGEGRLVDAGKLSDAGELLAGSDRSTAVVPRAPEGVLAGYFVIRANDRGDAERIARECPHLKYGGTISLREIES
jgi:hypothetical protein